VNSVPSALAILGAGSFAYHASNNDQASVYHTFDRFGAYYVALQTLHASVYVMLIFFASFCFTSANLETVQIWIGVAMAMLTMVEMSLIFVFWDGLYEQGGDYVFMGLGSALLVTATITRFCVVQRAKPDEKDTCGFRRTDVFIAAVETVVLFVVAFTALLMQSNFLGVTYNSLMDTQYDLYHGCWHVFLSLVIIMFYVRAEEAAGAARGYYKVKTRDPSTVEMLGAGLTVVYCTTLIIIKETQVSEIAALIFMTVFSSILQIYSMTIREFADEDRIWDQVFEDCESIPMTGNVIMAVSAPQQPPSRTPKLP
jgi:hypothetical protein